MRPSSTELRADPRAPFVLGDADRDRLFARLDLAVQRARRGGRSTLATLTLALEPEIDPSAVVCASRRAGEPWFVFEQPERKQAALAALGAVGREARDL
ncbi:MAG: hypothetical protein ACHQDY_07460, partial [Solirubrobacterales bacterium]